jgi:hypothetical protein
LKQQYPISKLQSTKINNLRVKSSKRLNGKHVPKTRKKEIVTTMKIEKEKNINRRSKNKKMKQPLRMYF